MNQLVDPRSKAVGDRRRRELNITIFNLHEHSSQDGSLNKARDEEDIAFISSKLGLEHISIKTSFRLGGKIPQKYGH